MPNRTVAISSSVLSLYKLTCALQYFIMKNNKLNVFLLFLFVFPTAVIHGHGCSFFRLADKESTDRFMSLSDDLVPNPVKDFATFVMGTDNPSVPFGVYDCHEGKGEYEVGYSAACIDNGTCMCTALYNFMECRSCELACDADINNLDINSFQADCSNVKTDISQTCTVECGYTTYSCFEDDPEKSSAVSLSSRILATFMLITVSFLLPTWF